MASTVHAPSHAVKEPDPSLAITEVGGGELVKPELEADRYLKAGQDNGASDVHPGASAQPIWRRHGALAPIWPEAPYLTADDTQRIALQLLTDHQKQQLFDRGDIDFAYE